MTFEKQIRQWLKDWKKVVVLGIGSPLRTDDGVGPIFIQKLSRHRLPESIKLLNCETNPENFTREITTFNPTHIILIDSAQLHLKPGTVKLVPTEKIRGLPVSTHTLPLSFISEYLKHLTQAKIILLAIQPKNIDFGTSLTPELERASTRISRLIANIFSSVH